MQRINNETLLNLYFAKCEFDDECDICGNPNHEQSWAQMTGSDGEVEYYLCQSCALKIIKKWKKEDNLNV